MMIDSSRSTMIFSRRLKACVIVGAMAVLVLTYRPATNAVIATSPTKVTPSPASPTSAAPASAAVRAGGTPSVGEGVAGCAAANCHGGPVDDSRRDWRSAFSVWAAEDPHRRAFAVLYSARSVEIFRNLNPAEPSADETPNRDQYAQFLTRRCVGCHATQTPADSVESLLDGVTCASCHAQPAGWREGHYLVHWPPASDPELATLIKSLAASNLRTRAAICAACHVGPQRVGDQVYDVTHDLIAAGHPRMAFEFATYLANFPKHWNAAADQARYERTTGGRFNVDAWRIGQEVAAHRMVDQWKQRLDAATSDPAINAWPEFSHFECADCHHQLATPDASRPRAARARGRTGTPRVAFESLDYLARLQRDAAPGDDSLAQQANLARSRLEQFEPPTFGLAASVDELRRSLSQSPLLEPCPSDGLIAHGRVLSRLVRSTPDKSDAAAQSPTTNVTWESAVGRLLAVDALAHDLPAGPATASLREDIRQLRAALSDPRNFAEPANRAGKTRRGTIYDSPTSFEPARVLGALSRIADQLEFESLYLSPAEPP